MLLDDPLSALNGSVANHVYNNVIGRHGIMNGKLPCISSIMSQDHLCTHEGIPMLSAMRRLLSLAGSAIVLATHHTHFLRDCSKVLYLHEGRALAFAPFGNLPPEIMRRLPNSGEHKFLGRELVDMHL